MKLRDLGFSPSESEARSMIKECLQVVELYDWIINSLVLDFFSESLWSRFPPSWQGFLRDVPPTELGAWLSTPSCCDVRRNTLPFPLSLLALRAVLSKLSLRRNPLHLGEEVVDSLLRVKVNPKKEHELQRMATLVGQLAEETGTNSVLDFGSGIGHLSRRLFFLHGLQTTCLESQEPLCIKARERDIKYAAKRRKPGSPLPVHTPITISRDLNPFKDSHSPSGFVGLHACGDFSDRILSFFRESPPNSFLALATCCYMRGEEDSLSYEAKELGCHALETYAARLSSSDYESLLRVHCYRALLEAILLSRGPRYRHIPLKSLPKTHTLSFKDYATSACSHLEEVHFTPEEIQCAEESLGRDWWRVAVFYVIRLSLGPLIESLIFLKRYLTLKETQQDTAILPLFDPTLSPRNLVIASIKNK